MSCMELLASLGGQGPSLWSQMCELVGYLVCKWVFLPMLLFLGLFAGCIVSGTAAMFPFMVLDKLTLGALIPKNKTGFSRVGTMLFVAFTLSVLGTLLYFTGSWTWSQIVRWWNW